MKFKTWVLALAVMLGWPLHDLSAQPARIIILRHGEKQDDYQLCQTGVQRSLALVRQYLGKGGADSLFTPNTEPAAIFAITLHTVELATPFATTWHLPLFTYPVMPMATDAAFTDALNQATRTAAHDVLTDPRWNGKTVVMVWEHDHIAKRRLEAEFHGQNVTLRQSLNLDRIGGVPADWDGTNFDYFWIVDYRSGSDIPVAFHTQKQVFAPPFQDVPSNDWGVAEPPAALAGCQH